MRFVIENTSAPSLRGRELMLMLAAEQGCSAPLEYMPSGKPYLKGSALGVSMSHSGSYVLAGVHNGEIGVDIEVVRDFDRRIISRFFTGAEQEYALNDPIRFFEVWTAKEAYLKLTGDGLKGIKLNTVVDGRIFIDGVTVQSGFKDGCVYTIVYR